MVVVPVVVDLADRPFQPDLVVTVLTDHLVVVPVVVLEQVLDLVEMDHLSQHQKVEIMVIMVEVQAILLVLMDLVEAVVPVVLVVRDQVLNQEQVVLEFR